MQRSMENSSQPILSLPRRTVSVIVPVYNGGANFRRCLSSLTEALPSPDEIIVVVDGDADASWRTAQEFDAKVLRLPTPRGPARARNLGAQNAHGDILFFVDADVTVSQNAIGQVASAFLNDPELAALFGSYDDEPSSPDFPSQYKNLLHHYVHQTSQEEASTFWSGCGAIRRTTFMAIGGFNESYGRPSIEDIELGYRLQQAGHRIRLCKELQVKHLKRWGVASLWKSDFFDRALPWTELILRDRRFINDLNLRFSSRLSVIATYGFLAALSGILWRPDSLAVAFGFILLLLGLNAPLYRFFRRKRGLWFALKVIPFHWFYYFYSGLAFGLGLSQYLLSDQRRFGKARPADSKGKPTKSTPVQSSGWR